eukprot:TRINITY_DN7350_c0_g4_i1.p1 TRINITY_DN7350_c0_g4~~TRINITY_DN7350_c0_g4_i1.p1  ORF type:complete len:640 (+),score=110.64 TRINITY_DN7350_c0_g4_i1:23-1921(+)
MAAVDFVDLYSVAPNGVVLERKKACVQVQDPKAQEDRDEEEKEAADPMPKRQRERSPREQPLSPSVGSEAADDKQRIAGSDTGDDPLPDAPSDPWDRLEQRLCEQLALHESRIISEICTSRKGSRRNSPPSIPRNVGVKHQREAEKPRTTVGSEEWTSELAWTRHSAATTGASAEKAPRKTGLVNFLGDFKMKRVGSDVMNGFNSMLNGSKSVPVVSVHSSEIQSWSHVLEGDGIHEQSSFKTVNVARFFMKQRWFHNMIAVLIIVNSFTIAVDADLAVKYPAAPKPEALRIIDITITAVFLVELLLRMIAEGCRFVSLHNRHLKWNVLDSVLVFSAVGEEICRLLAFATVDMSFIRVIRFFRLVRVIRVVRVMRFFKDLRVMIASILMSVKSLCWALLLLFLLAFMFATFILEFVSGELEILDAEVDRERIATLKFYFGSLPITIFSLFKSITSGVDWGDPAQVLVDISPFLGFMFALYVAFATLCVMNIIIGIFVENSSVLALKDEQTLVLESVEEKNQWHDEVVKLFYELGGDEWIEQTDFEDRIGDFNVQAKIRKLGLEIEPQAMLGLFDVLDFDKSGLLSQQDFVLGLKMLHGHAKSIDIARLLRDNGRIQKELKDIRKDVRKSTAK